MLHKFSDVQSCAGYCCLHKISSKHLELSLLAVGWGDVVVAQFRVDGISHFRIILLTADEVDNLIEESRFVPIGVDLETDALGKKLQQTHCIIGNIVD